LGNIVVDAKGMSLYYFTKDVKDSGTSACTGGCLTAWPPLITTSATPKVEGVTGKVGTITTPAGAKQVTLNGMPLYYFAKDTKAGDVLGQGVNNVWYVADPAGEMITKMPAAG
jgi:predicted lipoprotein with Yx(FWY)xxD motif